MTAKPQVWSCDDSFDDAVRSMSQLAKQVNIGSVRVLNAYRRLQESLFQRRDLPLQVRYVEPFNTIPHRISFPK